MLILLIITAILLSFSYGVSVGYRYDKESTEGLYDPPVVYYKGRDLK